MRLVLALAAHYVIELFILWFMFHLPIELFRVVIRKLIYIYFGYINLSDRYYVSFISS